MSEIDISLLMVHTFESRIARQTLRNIRRIAPRLRLEVIVIDNHPVGGFGHMLAREFPEVRYIPLEKNRGFGSAMNVGMRAAKGEMVCIFNPDLAPEPGSFEALLAYLRAHPDVGMVGPRLQNPDGSLQFSSFAQPTLLIPVFRRTFLGKTTWGKKHLDAHQMREQDHDVAHDVAWIMGSAMLARRDDLLKLGGFDEQFFMYFEDADLCRRVHEMGKRVMYFPGARMIHYHRRATADGSFLQQILNPLTWQHIRSALLYARKYRHGTAERKKLQNIPTT